MNVNTTLKQVAVAYWRSCAFLQRIAVEDLVANIIENVVFRVPALFNPIQIPKGQIKAFGSVFL